jgi:hypothetical protein
MKRKLSLLMVLMMMLTLIPANMAFAGSDPAATVRTTSSEGTVDFYLEIEATGTGIATGIAPSTSPAIFSLTLDSNAEWKDMDGDGDVDVNDFTGYGTFTAPVPTIITPVRATSKRVEFTINNAIVPNGKIVISGMQVEFDGATDGEQKVEINDVMNSDISYEKVTYAVVSGSGNLITKRLGDMEILTRGQSDASEFEIREVTANVLANGEFVIELPKDVEWLSTTTVTGAGATASVDSNNKRRLNVTVSGTSPTTLERIVVTPKISILKDAKVGEIEVRFLNQTFSTTGSPVKAKVEADSLVIAEYKDYGVTLKVDKVEEIVAGRVDEDSDYTVKVTLDPAGNSFNVNRPIDLTVDNGDVKIKTVKNAYDNVYNNAVGATNTLVALNSYDDELEFYAKDASSKIEFEFYVKADWDSTEPIEITVSGGGVDEQTVEVAKVLAPAKVTTKVDANKTVADVVVGLQNQNAPEITITETQANALREGYYVIDFVGSRYEGIEFMDSDLDYETTGDINVDDVTVEEDGTKLLIAIDEESDKEASTIVIKGLKVTLDRSVPYGEVNARLAFVGELNTTLNAQAYKDADDIIEKLPFLNVVTEVQTARQQKTVFTLDSATYTVGSETKTLDAAPYISNNRTMLPIGTVAQLAGATLNYSPSTRTAVFTKDNLVVSMNLDTNILLVNGSPVPMDAKPEIVNSRAFVPVVYVAQAFGIQNGTDIVYDAASRTVTLFPNAQ